MTANRRARAATPFSASCPLAASSPSIELGAAGGSCRPGAFAPDRYRKVPAIPPAPWTKGTIVSS
jgi:hypothetical protein